MSAENEAKKAALGSLFAPKAAPSSPSGSSPGSSNPLLGAAPANDSGGNGGSGSAAAPTALSRVQMMKAEAEAKEALRVANGGGSSALSPNMRAAPEVLAPPLTFLRKTLFFFTQKR